MIRKVLIANRGEIALSIQRNCNEMGVETVAVYSDVDKGQPAIYLADQSICIGSGKSSASYLNVANILTAAIESGCEAIHPGYGFLAENGDFAEKVEACGLKLIGPSSKVINLMGNKLSARNLMEESGVPVVPGCNDVVHDEDQLYRIADEIGYPVLLKASAGGGGKGMRRIYKREDLVPGWELTRREAKASFANDDIYIEKLIENPRHIEIQILADSLGNVVYLPERDCSIQRNNQKIIEESPSRANSDLLEKMYKSAVMCAKACGYEGTGTVEFIVDKYDNYYFMEMNTRIQVEYPVTEMVTGINLIKEQIRIASGLPLSVKQEDVAANGHAIEVRVNAQNPYDNFRPSCGEISFFLPPGGLDTRFETALYQGAKILPFYDSMMAKLIVKGSTRMDAIKKLRRAVSETIIDGVPTNLGFIYAILYDKDFILGNIDTNYVAHKEAELLKSMHVTGE